MVAIFIGLVESGPALRQHWFNVWCLLGRVTRICFQIIRGPPLNYYGGGGVKVLNRTNYLFHLRSAIFYLIHTLPQAKY